MIAGRGFAKNAAYDLQASDRTFPNLLCLSLDIYDKFFHAAISKSREEHQYTKRNNWPHEK